jgi:hypothetical protein
MDFPSSADFHGFDFTCGNILHPAVETAAPFRVFAPFFTVLILQYVIVYHIAHQHSPKKKEIHTGLIIIGNTTLFLIRFSIN